MASYRSTQAKAPSRPRRKPTRSMPARSNKSGATRGQARAAQVKAMNASRRSRPTPPAVQASSGLLRIDKFMGATPPSPAPRSRTGDYYGMVYDGRAEGGPISAVMVPRQKPSTGARKPPQKLTLQ